MSWFVEEQGNITCLVDFQKFLSSEHYDHILLIPTLLIEYITHGAKDEVWTKILNCVKN